MDKVDVILTSSLAISTLGYAVSTLLYKKIGKEELKRLQNTPIEVYRYEMNICMNDGSEYLYIADRYVTYSFERFVGDIILDNETLKVGRVTVLNTRNISSVEILDCESKMIEPIILTGYKDKRYVCETYSIREALELEVK